MKNKKIKETLTMNFNCAITRQNAEILRQPNVQNNVENDRRVIWMDKKIFGAGKWFQGFSWGPQVRARLDEKVSSEKMKRTTKVFEIVLQSSIPAEGGSKSLPCQRRFENEGLTKSQNWTCGSSIKVVPVVDWGRFYLELVLLISRIAK